MVLGRDCVSQRLEKFSYERLSCATAHDCQAGDKWNGLVGQFLSSLAAPSHRRAESAAQGDAEKRREDIRTIIHVLIKRSSVVLSSLPTNQADRIHVEKQRRCATLGCRFGIKDM